MKKILIKSAQIIASLIILSSCNSSSSTEQTTAKTSITKTDIKTVFDVPSLIGKNIDEVRKILGKPTDKEIDPSKAQLKMDLDSWDNNFEKDGYSLLVTYNPQNRKVIDFFISTKDPSGITSDYSDLLKVCNITNDNTKYTVEPVPTIKDDTKYTGIKITAK